MPWHRLQPIRLLQDVIVDKIVDLILMYGTSKSYLLVGCSICEYNIYIKLICFPSVFRLFMVHFQLTSLLSEIGLNIQETQAFSTVDGYSLDVFVVDGWALEVLIFSCHFVDYSYYSSADH